MMIKLPKALALMKFAYHAEANFVNGLRVRKSKPGLFWGLLIFLV